MLAICLKHIIFQASMANWVTMPRSMPPCQDGSGVVNQLTFLQKLTEPVLLLIMPLWIAPMTKHAVLGGNFFESKVAKHETLGR